MKVAARLWPQGTRSAATLALICLLPLLGSCFQAQLYGPVSGARITVTSLADATTVVASTRADSRQSLLQEHGEADWEDFGPERRLWFLGVFRLELEQLRDDGLYLVTASGGRETDRDADGREDQDYTPVSGTWRAILTGAQLKSSGPKVSPLTEAAYQWLRDDLGSMEEHRVLYNLDRAATALVTDVDDDGVVGGGDLLHWSRLFDGDKLLADPSDLDRMADSVISGETGEGRRAAARALLPLAVDRDTAEAQFLPGVLERQLAGLKFDPFLEQSFRWLLQRSPEDIVQLGLDDRYGSEKPLLDDISDQAEQLTAALAEVILARLQAFQRARLSGEQRLSRDIYEWYLEDLIAGTQYQLLDYPASSFITGVPYSTLFFFTDIHPLESAADAGEYLARLAQVPQRLEQLRRKVAARADAGVIEPAITLEWGIDALKVTADAWVTSTAYYRRLDDALRVIPDLDDAESARLRSEARSLVQDQVQPVYQALISDLEALRARAPQAIGIGQFERGDAFYAWALRHHTTTDMSAQRIHRTGLDELDRLRGEIDKAAVALGYPAGQGLVELYELVARDGGSLFGNAILEGYQDLVEAAEGRLEEVFDVLPRQDVVVIGGPTGGFYVRGSLDGSRPGAFYAATSGQQARYNMATLAYHEAVPGHHLQIALAQELDLPEFRRHIGYTGFVEGWALYAERLAHELGWYAEDPYGNLGRLQFEAIRAARLVVDTGIHHYGWSWNRAVDFYRQNTGSSLRASQGSVGRFMRWPGQATAYMIGMNRLLELRADGGYESGDRDALKEFHRQVLSGGAMPLSVLARVID